MFIKRRLLSLYSPKFQFLSCNIGLFSSLYSSSFINWPFFILVRIQFVTTQNDIGFAREKAQTISFVERGFERVSLSHRTMVCRGIYVELNRVRSRSLSLGGGLGGSSSLPYFLPPFFGSLVPLFILACIPYPSSTCRIDFPRLILVPSAHTQSGWGWL